MFTLQMASTASFYLQTASLGQLLGAGKGSKGTFQGQGRGGETHLLETTLRVIRWPPPSSQRLPSKEFNSWSSVSLVLVFLYKPYPCLFVFWLDLIHYWIYSQDVQAPNHLAPSMQPSSEEPAHFPVLLSSSPKDPLKRALQALKTPVILPLIPFSGYRHKLYHFGFC